MSEPKSSVTMTRAELTAFVNAQIAEHEAAKKPKPEPRPAEPPGRYQIQPSAELDTALLALFDRYGHEPYQDIQASQAASAIYDSKPRSAGLFKLLESWRGCPFENLDWVERLQERGRVAQHMLALDRKRKHPNEVADLLADRLSKENQILDGAHYWADAEAALAREKAAALKAS